MSDPEGAPERIEATVRGRVQGVGYRFHAASRAGALRLRGAVRNLPDGSVEVCAEGPRETLLAFVAALRDGPPSARVESLRVRWTAARGDAEGFEIAR